MYLIIRSIINREQAAGKAACFYRDKTINPLPLLKKYIRYIPLL